MHSSQPQLFLNIIIARNRVIYVFPMNHRPHRIVNLRIVNLRPATSLSLSLLCYALFLVFRLSTTIYRAHLFF